VRINRFVAVLAVFTVAAVCMEHFSRPIASGQILPTAGVARTGAFLVNVESQSIHPKHLDDHVQYAFASMERYFVYVPAGYTGSESYGLIVFTDATSGNVYLPSVWRSVLDIRV
jgi:hypothetical protein